MRTLVAMVLFMQFPAAGLTKEIKFGSIKGRVNYCASGGVEGMVIYVPGKKYVVITGQNGSFSFDAIPIGNYDIHYALSSRVLNRNSGIEVYADKYTDIGEIAFCDEQNAPQSVPDVKSHPPSVSPDRPKAKIDQASQLNASSTESSKLDEDSDGVSADKDCDDHNALVRPGLVERCDGIDNNCNGQIDEIEDFNFTRGVGRCLNGQLTIKACDKGYADCDNDLSNGCETHIFGDDENCGACGNVCSTSESCALGLC